MKVPFIINKKRVHSLDELKENINIKELIMYVKTERFSKWLKSINNDELANEISTLEKDLDDRFLAENILTLLDIQESKQDELLAIFPDPLKKENIEKKIIVTSDEFKDITSIIDNYPSEELFVNNKNSNTGGVLHAFGIGMKGRVTASMDNEFKFNKNEFNNIVIPIQKKYSPHKVSVIIQHLFTLFEKYEKEYIAILTQESRKKLFYLMEIPEYISMLKYLAIIDMLFCNDYKFAMVINKKITCKIDIINHSKREETFEKHLSVYRSYGKEFAYRISLIDKA